MAQTLGITGMDPATESALKAAFEQANARLGRAWRLVSDQDADYVIVDMDSMYGPMSWLRLHAAGKRVIGLTASPRTLIQLQTRVRYTTMIVLPEGEEILDVICGDKDFWVVSATQHRARVHDRKKAGLARAAWNDPPPRTSCAMRLVRSHSARPRLQVEFPGRWPMSQRSGARPPVQLRFRTHSRTGAGSTGP